MPCVRMAPNRQKVGEALTHDSRCRAKVSAARPEGLEPPPPDPKISERCPQPSTRIHTEWFSTWLP